MKCIVCNEIIDIDRSNALLILGKSPQEMTCIKHAPDNKIKGIYNSGELIIVDTVGPSGIKHDNQTFTIFDV